MKNWFKILACLCTLFLLVGVPDQSYAQTEKPGKIRKYVRKGRKAYNKGEYWKAKGYYEKATSANTPKSQHWLEAGIVYYDSQVEREKSLDFFLKALEYSEEGDTIPQLYYYTAKAYQFVGDYESALDYYNRFLQNVENSKKGMETRKEVVHEIEICNNGIDLRNQKQDREATIDNMGPNVNSDSPDYVPVVTSDENLILFCSRRPPGKKKNIDGLYYEDIFYTTKENGEWQQADVIDKSSGYLQKEINDGKSHEAPISLSPDGNTLFIYKENSIWKSTKDPNGKWSVPQRMNQNVNIGEANPSVFITEDGTEMFIVSVGAEGGYGERDIYYSKKNENGTWDKPVNLGPTINTPYKEDAPFLSKDGKTLYFASQGHNSIGGFDIFKTVRDENGVWSDPVNIGSPINSAGDDIYYVENEEGTLAYFASMRPGSFGYLDLYTAKFGCSNIPTTEIKGYAIYADNHLPVNGTITITDKETGENLGNFKIDAKTGKYSLVVKPERTYILELVIDQSRFNKIRPHKEEFFVPKQCEYYNLYQEISIEYLTNAEGAVYAQKATFKNAMFDIDQQIKDEYGDVDLDGDGTSSDYVEGISGNITHNGTMIGQNIEVTLMNQNYEILRYTNTDKKGNFYFEKLDPAQNYIVMINEGDAIRSFQQENPGAQQVQVEGFLYNFKDSTRTPRSDVTLYIGDNDRKIKNDTITAPNGHFQFSNVTSDATKIDEINNNHTITYKLNTSNAEIQYSAYIMHIDPNNTDLIYTEVVDIIDLKDYVDTLSGSEGQQFANILFDFDKFFLRQKSIDVLESLYQFMKANPTVTVRLDGHTDWFGTEQYNVGLSKNRALSAHKYLIDKGINPNRIENQWFGEANPTVANDNPDGSDNPDNRQLNRRVEIKVEIPEMADIYLSL